MKKATTNFWINVLSLVSFIGVIFTGVLLHRFSPELKESTILGVTRYDWGSVHWILALSFFTIIIVHLVLHWNWAKGSFKKYLRVGPVILVTVTLIVIFLGLLAPAYLTKDFPSRKDFRDTYSNTSSLAVENKEGVTAIVE
jgi:hypothetical protein